METTAVIQNLNEMDKIYIEEIARVFQFEVIASFDDLEKREVKTYSLSRPALELAGYEEFFSPNSFQVIGLKELRFMESQTEEELHRAFQIITNSVAIPAIIICHGYKAPEKLVELAKRNKIPVLGTPRAATSVISDLSNYLRDYIAPMTNLHGVMLDISGVGVLITGESGVGKSETALELILKGNQLVADDRVVVYEKSPGLLIGRAPKLLEHMMEIRGLGVVNVKKMYGSKAVRDKKQLSLIIELCAWDHYPSYDRVGTEVIWHKVINTHVSKILVPIRPGRSTASIIEAAVLNYQLKENGDDSAKEFIDRLNESIQKNK
ncbi:MAG: HPr(Ser) kinase/phosphatase [Culicoidibacterales bacterium]